MAAVASRANAIYFFHLILAELGDFDQKRHTMGYVSEFRFLPNQVRSFINMGSKLVSALQSWT